MIGPEALERALDRAADVVGRAVELADRRHVPRGGAVHPPGELGRDHVLVAVALDRSPDELLVGHRTVQLRGVEEVDPELERPLDRGDRLALVGRPVERRLPHAHEPELRRLERSKLARVHACSIRWQNRVTSTIEPRPGPKTIAHLARTTNRRPPLGPSVGVVTIRGSAVDSGSSLTRASNTVASARSSYSANRLPRHIRDPPPNGI
jgi:hypothetical protein